jgi:hypothetical protein
MGFAQQGLSDHKSDPSQVRFARKANLIACKNALMPNDCNTGCDRSMPTS